MKKGITIILGIILSTILYINFVSAASISIFITNPSNTTYTTNVNVINYTLTNDTGYCWYSNNSGAWNSTYKNATALNFTGVVSIEGSNTWRVYCNTSDGTQNFTNVTFFKDTVTPSLLIKYPLNITYGNVVNQLNYSMSELTGFCYATIYNSSGVWTSPNIPAGTNFTSLGGSEGANTMILYCNDSLGNQNSSIISFYQDSSTTIIDYGNSTFADYTNISSTSINTDATVTILNEANITYLLYNTTSLVNSTSYTDSRRAITWTGLPAGTYFYNITIRNTANIATATSSRTITLDSSAPQVYITSPINYLNQTSMLFSLNATVIDTGTKVSNTVFSIYNLSGSLINSTTNTTIVSGVRLANLAVPATGNYLLNISVSDFAGNSNSSSRYITADNTAPVLFITSPIINRTYYVNQSILIIYNASDLFPVVRWYSNSTRNFSYSGPASVSYKYTGVYNITLYANDSLLNQVSFIIPVNIQNLSTNDTIVTTNQSINVNENTSTIIVPPNSSLTSVSLTNSTAVVHFDLSQLMNGSTVTLTNNFTLTTIGESGINYTAFIPNGVNITGGDNWNGIITLPTVNLTSFTQPTVTGYTTSAPSIVIDMGPQNESVNFSSPVKITIGGMAGKRAAWARGSSSLTDITTHCSDPDTPGISSGECYVDSGSDLVIWTYHFTSFAAYAATAVVSGGGNTGGSSNSGSGGGLAPLRTYALTSEDLTKGDSRYLGKGDNFKFTIAGKDHTLTVDNVNKTVVIVTLASDPNTALLNLGEEKKFDVDNDNYYDIIVKLNQIVYSSRANLTIKGIHEQIMETVSNENPQATDNKPKEQTPVTPASTANPNNNLNKKDSGMGRTILLVTILVVVILLIIIAVVIRKHRKKHNTGTHVHHHIQAKPSSEYNFY